MSYQEDNFERLDYDQQQQFYHRATVDDAQVKGWQTVCMAHPRLIDWFRVTHPELRGSCPDVRQRFVALARPFIMPDA